MRKILSVIVVVAMLVTGLIPSMIFSTGAESANEVEFVVSTTDFVENADGMGEATVTLSIANNPGLSSANVLIYYANDDLSVDGEMIEGTELYDYSGITPNRRSTLSSVKGYFTAAGITPTTAIYCALVEIMEYCDPETGDPANSTFTGDIATFTVTTNTPYADLLAESEEGIFTLPLGFILGEACDADGNEVATTGSTFTFDISSPEPDPFAPVVDTYAGGVTDTCVIDVAGVSVFMGTEADAAVPANVMVPIRILNNNADVNPIGIWSVRVYLYYDPALQVVSTANSGQIFPNSAYTEGALNDNLLVPVLASPNPGARKAFEACNVNWTENDVDFTCGFWAYTEDAYAQIFGDGDLGYFEFALPADTSIGSSWEIGLAMAPSDLIDFGPDTDDPETNGIPQDVPFVMDNGYIKVLPMLPIAEEETFDALTVNVQNVLIAEGSDSVEVGIEIANNPGIANAEIALGLADGIEIVEVESDLYTATYADGVVTLASDAAVNESGVVATLLISVPADAKAGTSWAITATATADGAEVAADAGSITVFGACSHGKTVETVVDPTCTSDGSLTVTCENCGEILSVDVLPATGHAETRIEGAYSATCTEQGFTGNEICVACGELIMSGEFTPALGHTAGDKVTTLEPTYTTEGAWEIGCSVCGEIIETGVIPALSMPTFSIGSADAVVGRVVTVPVAIDNNGGLFIIKLVVEYDEAVLLNPSVLLGDIFTAENVIFNVEEPGRIVLYFEAADNANVTGNGDLAYITFTVADDASLFNTTTALSISAADGDVVDYAGNSYEVVIENGEIAFAQPETIAVADVIVTEGEEIKVPVTIASNPGIWAIKAKISYDQWGLTLAGLESGLFAVEEGINYSVTDGVITVFLEGADLANVTEDGTLFTIVFDSVDSYLSDANLEYALDLEIVEVIDVDADDYTEFVSNSGSIIVEPAPIGTELNPYWLYDNTSVVEIPAGATYLFNAYFSEMMVDITGENFTVVYNGQTFENAFGQIVTANGPRMPVAFYVTNNGDAAAEYTINAYYPVGSIQNPEVIEDGTYTHTFELEDGEYYYSWTAPEGVNKMDFSISATTGWQYAIDNYTTWYYGDIQWSDSDPVLAETTIAVEEGDQIIIHVVTYDPAAWGAVEGAITITVEGYFECDHATLVHYEAVDPTCHGTGNIECWYCEDCQSFFQDEACTQLTNSKRIIIPALGTENLQYFEAVEPGCHTLGNTEYWYCPDCDCYFADEACTMVTNRLRVIIPETGSENLVHYEALDATCHDDGYVEHWYCPDCDVYFLDEACTMITNAKSVVIPATGSENLVHFDALEPACHSEGNVEYWYCPDCGKVWLDENLTLTSNYKSVILPAVGTDNLVHYEALEATCHDDGYVEHWYCPDCDCYFLDEACTMITNAKSVVIPATGSENFTHVEAIPATCHSEGNVEYWYCPDCGKVWLDEALTQLTNIKSVILPALGPQNLVHYEALEATCHDDGYVEHWYCPDCDVYFLDEANTMITNAKSVVIPATGSENLVHFDALDPTCHGEGNVEYWYCPDCGKVWLDEALTQLTNIKSVILPALGSENLEYFEAVPATCHGRGNVEYWYCPDCDVYFADEACTIITNALSIYIPELGSENLQYFAAKAPTATEDGNIEYWYCPDCDCYFADEACTIVTNAKSVIIPALGVAEIDRVSGTDYVKEVYMEGNEIFVTAGNFAPYVKIAIGYGNVSVDCDNIVGGGAGFSYIIINADEYDVENGVIVTVSTASGSVATYKIIVTWYNVLFNEVIEGYTVSEATSDLASVIDVYAKEDVTTAAVGIKFAEGIQYTAPEDIDVVLDGGYVYFRATKVAVDSSYVVILTDKTGATHELTINYHFDSFVLGVEGGYMVDDITLVDNVITINASSAYSYVSFRFLVDSTDALIAAQENVELVVSGGITYLKLYNDGTNCVIRDAIVNVDGIDELFTIVANFN